MNSKITSDVLLKAGFKKAKIKTQDLPYYYYSTDKYDICFYPRNNSFLCQVSDTIGYNYYATLMIETVDKFNKLMDVIDEPFRI